MTKSEAKQKMEEGHKVTHRLFAQGEYIYSAAGDLFDENGYQMDGFWEYRDAEIWTTGWSIYTDANDVQS
jgi:hypothetical protein